MEPNPGMGNRRRKDQIIRRKEDPRETMQQSRSHSRRRRPSEIVGQSHRKQLTKRRKGIGESNQKNRKPGLIMDTDQIQKETPQEKEKIERTSMKEYRRHVKVMLRVGRIWKIEERRIRRNSIRGEITTIAITNRRNDIGINLRGGVSAIGKKTTKMRVIVGAHQTREGI